jgi:pyruvate kinase
VKRAKIIATIGPASSDSSVVRGLIAAGMNVARLNLSHGEREEHEANFATIRAEAERAGAAVAILADLWAKIRVGLMAGAPTGAGSRIAITTDDVLGTAERISTSYQALAGDVRPDDPILLDDGLLRLEVEEVRGREVVTRVVVGGTLKDRKGMNLPGTPLSTPALTDKDRRDLELVLGLGVDYVALSFVRRPEDVLAAKRWRGRAVIAKIEKPEAIEHREAIADAADGLMVARGDLGVEAGFDKVPLMQKQLIRDAAARGKPVIVATQMLESMIASPVPTRAEVSDVANAVLDGADALMLSGETAIGAYPVEAVRRMAGVIAEVEASELYRLQPEPVRIDEYSFDNAGSRGPPKRRKLEGDRRVHRSGQRGLVSYRPRRILHTRKDSSLRMAQRWGWSGRHRSLDHRHGGGAAGRERTVVERGLAPGDDIAVTFGMLEISGPGRTNVLTLWRVRDGARDEGPR